MKNAETPRKDPLIDEVRERRARLCARYGDDLMKLHEAIRALQEQHPEMVASPQRRA